MQHVYVKKHTFHYMHWTAGAFNTHLACCLESSFANWLKFSAFLKIVFLIGQNNKNKNNVPKKGSCNNTDTLNWVPILLSVLNVRVTNIQHNNLITDLTMFTLKLKKKKKWTEMETVTHLHSFDYFYIILGFKTENRVGFRFRWIMVQNKVIYYIYETNKMCVCGSACMCWTVRVCVCVYKPSLLMQRSDRGGYVRHLQIEFCPNMTVMKCCSERLWLSLSLLLSLNIIAAQRAAHAEIQHWLAHLLMTALKNLIHTWYTFLSGRAGRRNGCFGGFFSRLPSLPRFYVFLCKIMFYGSPSGQLLITWIRCRELIWLHKWKLLG